MNEGKLKKVKHYAKPAKQVLLELCKNPDFKERVEQIRHKWKIKALVKSSEEAIRFWKDFCAIDKKELDILIKRHGNDTYDEEKARHRQFQRELETLCKEPAFRLPADPNMWLTLFEIVLRFDLDKVSEEDILTLPLPPMLARVSIDHKDNRLYLDVTFATWKDVAEIWKAVEYWQAKIRPAYIKRGLLPNSLKDIKAGRPPIPDKICIEAAKLKSEGRTYKEIAVVLGLPIKGLRSSSAQKAVKLGRILLAKLCT